MLPNQANGAPYDHIADWYLPWVGTSPGLIFEPAAAMIAERLDGQRWLDVACGFGRTSRELARRGATVVGVDLSERLIERAEQVAEALLGRIAYRVADITSLDDWWDGTPFDGVTCEMALMDIDDLPGTITAVSSALRSNGKVRMSMVHPCFPGNTAGLPSWPPEGGYGAEGFWTSGAHNPDGVRIRVGSSHRTLATYLNAMLDAGWSLERVWEPPASVPTWLTVALCKTS